MEIAKTSWTADKNSFHMQTPFAKVNKEKRQVSGFATLDNADQHDDIVLAEASRKAFSRFRGNIREMHQPIAAGRLVDFVEKSFYDADTDKTYTGIYVTAYISTGAESTWQKVLDGTLTGFSIGGSINDSEPTFNKANNKPVRIVKDYDLGELSLVDSPANQHANVFSIEKSVTGSVISGMVADTQVVNLFYCSEDEIFEKSSEESATCLRCDNEMVNAGWFEKGVDEDTQIKDVVAKFLRQSKEDDAAITKQADTATGEGGVKDMAEENKNEEETENTGIEETTEHGAADAVDEVTTDENEAGAATTDAPSENAEVVDEVQTDEPNFEKLFDGLKASLTEALADNKVAIEKSLDTKVSEVLTRVETLGAELEAVKAERKAVTKRLSDLEDSTAIKKSVDVEDESAEEKTLEKTSFWGEHFWNG